MRLDELGIDLDRPFGHHIPAAEPWPEEHLESLRQAFASPDYCEKIESLRLRLARSAHEAMSRIVD